MVGPAGDPPTVAQAVAAAGDGDTLLVTSDLSSAIAVVDGRSLSIVADPAVPTPGPAGGGLVIENLAAGQVVVLEKLFVRGAGTAAVTISDCSGSVRIDDCTLEGDLVGLAALPAVQVQQSSDVALSACLLTGGPGAPGADSFPATPGAAGLDVTASQLAAFGCLVNGGPGGDHEDDNGEPGGPSVRSPDGSLFLSGCTVTGGDGGEGGDSSFFPDCGGDGGPGLELTTTAAEVDAVATTFSGGAGGANTNPDLPCFGFPGPPTALAAGATLDSIPGAFRSLAVDAPAVAGVATDVRLRGAPGDLAYLYLSTGTAFATHPLFVGPQLFAPPVIRRFLVGTIPASGVLQTTLPTPALPPGQSNATLFIQGVLVDGAQQAWVADSQAWTRIDAASR